ncbi:MAG: threonine ammonia-lyase [Acidimicrobiia bacterium]|nr:threonine ammonia-lyase [Acidimicrobiia bacterium]
MGPRLVTLDDVRAAAGTLRGITRVTPVERPVGLSRHVGRPLVLKCEQLQRTGSFKARGAYHHLVRLDPVPPAGVVAASAGNHAQGIALAAGRLGMPATIFMPGTAPLPKVEATRAYGAEVRLVGSVFDDADAAAREHADATGAHVVPAFDDPDVVAGQGTVGLELAGQAPEATTFVVSIGGGGLVSGVAAALKALRPGCRVVGVQAEGAASMRAALAAGRPVPLERVDTIADGIAVRRVAELTLAHVQALVDDVVLVSDEEISRALILLLERAKVVVEPAAAAALAAVMTGRAGGEPGDPVGVVLSGGNVDPSLLARLISHGLSAAGRFLRLRVALPDRPGELHRLLGEIAGLGLNVVEVDHHRTGIGLPVDEVEVSLALETRDPGHAGEAVDLLAAAGYRVVPG